MYYSKENHKFFL
jgi:hypothetical protein